MAEKLFAKTFAGIKIDLPSMINISGKGIIDDEIVIITKLSSNNLKILDIRNNKIGTVGAEAISKAKWPFLQKLDI